MNTTIIIIIRRMCGVTKLDKIRNERMTGSRANRKESPGNYVEVVWACDVKIGALCRKEGDETVRTGEKEERKT